MAWYDPGGGAGVWDAATIEPDLRNIIAELCWAVNEREAYRTFASLRSITRSGSVANVIAASAHGLTSGQRFTIVGAVETDYNGLKTVATVPTLPAVSSITRSGSTATVTTAIAHGLNVGDVPTISGCTEPEYNGAKTITAVPTTTTFEYAVTGTPATPATGTPSISTTVILACSVSGSPSTPATGNIKYGSASTSFTYLEDFTKKKWPVADDFDGFPVYKTLPGPDLTVSTLGQAGGVGALHFPGIGLKAGHYFTVSGADQAEYNDDFQVTSVPAARSVTSITRSGSTATLTTGATHDLLTGDIAIIAGAAQAEYNGAFVITKTGANTLTYTVGGSPASPATGTITIQDMSRVYFDVDSGAAALATGTIICNCPATMIYKSTWAAGTARIYAKNHGYSAGHWVEVVNETTGGGGVDYRFWGPVTAVSANEWFEIAVSDTLSSPIHVTENDAGMWASRVTGIRKTLKEIQTGIEGLLTASVSANVIRFVEDSAPYETNYTLANLLGAGSYGSSWIDLMMLPIDEVGDAVLQMREALDLLVTTTVVISNDMDTGENVVKIGTGDPDQEISWDNAVAASVSIPGTTAQLRSDSPISIRQQRFGGSYLTYLCSTRTLEYTSVPMAGSFVDGFLRFWQSHEYVAPVWTSVDQSSTYTITDSDGDTFDADCSHNTTDEEIIVSKPEGFFTGSPYSLSFSTPEPASHPFPSLSANEGTARYVEQPLTSLSYPTGQYTRELVPGTHLTYG